MKIVIAGGGTAGHVYPGLALAESLLEKDKSCEILFIGSKRGIENKLIPASGFKLVTVPGRGLPRKIEPAIIGAAILFFLALFKSLFILLSFRPQVVVGMGGYISLPVVLAATLLGKRVVIHEQNSVPGLANKIAARVADQIAVSFPDSARFFKRKVILTGNPVRKRVSQATRQKLKPRSQSRTILIFGGSQGARRLNEAVVELYELVRERRDIRIVHLTGKRDFEQIRQRISELKKSTDKVAYHLYPYKEDIESIYSQADLVISRAGATTIAEITAFGLPAILIPYPYATEKHQEKNAQYLVAQGAARILDDQDVSGQALFRMINELVTNGKSLAKMRLHSQKLGKPSAAEDLARIVLMSKEELESKQG
jgi:UDP-N-acetylglucosamine--N-acetylmuramyl-(pentapeptide) pyrophosphoryl-undecaprenol N-acetylglucosamine transferase